jgi:regulatory protein
MSPTEDNFQKSALNKIINYCNYRDRSTKEIKIKLLDLSYSIEIIDSAISQATELGIVDNFRFSKSFSRGKNQKNRWGKIKIAYELKKKGLNNKEITFGIESIEEKTYYKVLMKSIEVYKRKSKNFKKNKIIKHLINKGYETALVISTIKKLNC